MDITVHLTPAASRALRRAAGGKGGSLRQALAALGVELHPLHPDTTSPELATHFTATVADPAEAERVAESLRQHPAVVAAYTKPAGDVPSAGPH